MKRILLTGGSGFIGRNILESFLNKKYQIIAPRSYELNLLDTSSVDGYFKDKEFDVVLHSGCKPGHRNAKDPTNLFYANTRMFQNIERHKDKYGKFLNFGSGAIYDTDRSISNVKEEDVFKYLGENEHSFCKYVVGKQIEKLDNFVDLNIFGIFGKYEDWEIRFISNSICKAVYNLPITLRQNRRFSYLFVNDLMPILDWFIENEPRYSFYNIVPDENVELLEIANIIKEISGADLEIKVALDGYSLDYTGSNMRLRGEISNLQFSSLYDSISLLFDIYKNNLNMINKSRLLVDK